MKDKRWGIYWAEQVYKKWQAEKEAKIQELAHKFPPEPMATIYSKYGNMAPETKSEFHKYKIQLMGLFPYIFFRIRIWLFSHLGQPCRRLYYKTFHRERCFKDTLMERIQRWGDFVLWDDIYLGKDWYLHRKK